MKQLSIYDYDFGNNETPSTTMFNAELELTPSEDCQAESNYAESFDYDSTVTSLNESKRDPRASVSQHDSESVSKITEIILSKEMANNVQLILPMLTSLNQENRWLAWIDPPITLLKQWQQKHQDQSTKSIMVLHSNESSSVEALSKAALKAGTCHSVIVWSSDLSDNKLRELEFAAQEGNSQAIILRYR